MVKAAQLNSLGFAEFLLRIRPGVAISVAAHVAIILFLAYVLAFPPVDPPAADSDKTVIEILPPAPPVEPLPPSMTPVKPLKLLVEPTRTIRTDIKVSPFSPPPDMHDETPAAVVSTAPPAPVVINPTPISRGGLFYPERAAERNVTGYVDFSFVIEPDGSVGDPQVIGEVPEGYGFAAAARKAFARWKFEPKTINGVPVRAPARIRISFKMR